MINSNDKLHIGIMKLYLLTLKYKNHIIKNDQGAWLPQKDLGFSKANNNISQPEAKGYYLQTQLLYDRYIGIGKPALVLRY
jgi:hypothetical protein